MRGFGASGRWWRLGLLANFGLDLVALQAHTAVSLPFSRATSLSCLSPNPRSSRAISPCPHLTSPHYRVVGLRGSGEVVGMGEG